MKRLFPQQIDVILEDVELFAPAVAAFEKLETTKDAVRDAEAALASEVDALHNRLALEIRRANPALTVTISRNGDCCVGYRHFGNQLSLRADCQSRIFTVGDTPFERRFKRYHGHCLSCDPAVVGRAVGDFFRQSYRSIR